MGVVWKLVSATELKKIHLITQNLDLLRSNLKMSSVLSLSKSWVSICVFKCTVAYNALSFLPDSPFFSEFGQMARLPLVHFPVSMPGYLPSSISSPSHQFLPNMWLPPVPVGYLYPPPLQPGPPAVSHCFYYTTWKMCWKKWL